MGNVRVRERFTLALDGRQIAAIVVLALLSLGAVFALGLKVGQRLGLRSAEAARPATVSDLEAVAGPPRAVPGKELTFSAELPRAKPAPPPPPATSRNPPAEQAEATPPERPSPEPAPAGVPTTAAASPAPAPAAPPPTPLLASPSPSSPGAFTVQLGASQRREEADALARKVKSFTPRVEEADIPGKGRFYRVRVGRFDSREAADKVRSELKREAGVSGLTVLAGK